MICQQETKTKVINRNVLDLNLNLGKSMTHHNQTKELTTWFLNRPLDESINNKKYKVRNWDPKSHETQLEDQKPRKAPEGHLEEGKTIRPAKRHEKQQTKQNGEEELSKSQKQNKASKKSSNSKTPLESNSP
jgi:hypothetical protein